MDADDEGYAAPFDAFDQKIEGVFGEFGIQIRNRLIGQYHVGLLHEGAGDGGALALATAERFDAPVAQAFEAYFFENGFGFFPFGGWVPAEETTPSRGAAETSGEYVVDDAHSRDEVKFLIDHGDVALDAHSSGAVLRAGIASYDDDGAGCRSNAAFDDAHERGFSRAASPQEKNALARLDCEGLEIEDAGSVVDDVNAGQVDDRFSLI